MASDPVIIKPPTALVYNDSIDTTNLTNVLIIDSTITDNKELYDSANANTFPIIYSYNSKTDDLLALLRQKFPASSIQRIALVFHDRGTNFVVPFMNNKILFEESDLIENQTSFTENVSFLIECIKEFNVANIDFLACNTLKYSNWKSYYSLLVAHTSVVVGASNDATGNVQYGGDWVMESTGEDIKQTYFTDSIDYYKYLLDTYTLNSIVYTYTIGTPSASVTGFVVDISNANIPLTIDISGNIYNVTSIGAAAFDNCISLNSVTIPNSVTTIGTIAFQGCTSLTYVTIGNSVATIGTSAFANCRTLTSVNIPNSVTIIADGAFIGCTTLTSISIPSSVTTIGDQAFTNCQRISAFSVDISNNNYSSDGDGVLFNKTKTILVQYPIGNTRTTYNILGSVQNIGISAFQNCTTLTSISIPSSVATIGDSAFQQSSNLVSVSIPSSVTTIRDYAFDLCTSLTAFAVDTSNNNYSSDVNGVLFNKAKTTLIQYPIGNIRTTYTIPSSVETIENDAFRTCTILLYIYIPNSVTSIGDASFFSCTKLTSVSIPNSVTSIGVQAFRGCAQLNLVYFLQTSSIPTIGTNAFSLIKTPSVGKYYSGVANLSSIEPPVFSSISPIDNIIPTLTTISPFTRAPNTLAVFSFTDLSGNGNEAVVNPPFVFLVPSVTTGLLSIGATQATATPWDASNNLINGSINAYWTPPDASGADAFTVIVQDAVGNVSSPNVQVPVNLCFKKGTKILCENGVYILIEELKIGDLVKTYKHGYQKIIMTAHSSLYYDSQNILDKLYTYSRESNPDLIEDLHLTGGHSLLVDGLTEEESANMKQIPWPDEEFMIEDKYKLLACYSSELCIAAKQNVEIYHFTLEPPENTKPTHVYGIYANGILAESCSQGAMEEALKKNNMLHDSCGSS